MELYETFVGYEDGWHPPQRGHKRGMRMGCIGLQQAMGASGYRVRALHFVPPYSMYLVYSLEADLTCHGYT